jgi:hypothetical protein
MSVIAFLMSCQVEKLTFWNFGQLSAKSANGKLAILLREDLIKHFCKLDNFIGLWKKCTVIEWSSLLLSVTY